MKRWWVSPLVTVGLAVGISLARGGFLAPDRVTLYQLWSDAFFVAGVLVGGVGILAFVSSNGLFDILRFGLGKLIRVPLSKERRDAYPKTFYEYRMVKRGEGSAGGSLVLSGLLSIAVGGVFLALYYQV